jgi:ribosomal-protein-alanine N-acetyltransferase
MTDTSSPDPVDEASRTARLTIEPLREAHAADLHPVLADPRIYLYVPDKLHPTVDSLAHRYALLERGAPAGERDVWLNWALWRTDTGECIGTLQATVTPDSHAYIGYTLGPLAWGRGFATEACVWLVAELTRRFMLTEILATVDVRNLASIRVLERIGFLRIGTEPAELHGETTTDYRYRFVPGPSA